MNLQNNVYNVAKIVSFVQIDIPVNYVHTLIYHIHPNKMEIILVCHNVQTEHVFLLSL